MPQVIDVQGVGHVEFPDGMTDDQISTAIQNEILPKAAPQQQQGALDYLNSTLPMGGMGGAPITAEANVSGLLSPSDQAKTLSKSLAYALPLDVGAGLRAISAIPQVAKYAAPVAGALSKAGNWLNPMAAKGSLGMIGKSAVNTGLGTGTFNMTDKTLDPDQQSNPVSDFASGALMGGVLGGGISAIPAIKNAGKFKALSSLDQSQLAQDYVDNLTNKVPPNQIQGKALDAVNQLRQASQKISNQNHQDIFNMAQQKGLDFTNPQNLIGKAQELKEAAFNTGDAGVINTVNSALKPDFNNDMFSSLIKAGLNKNDAQLLTSINPKQLPQVISQLDPKFQSAAQTVFANTTGLPKLESMRQNLVSKSMNAYNQGNGEAGYIYKNLADAIHNDITGTLTPELNDKYQQAKSFYRQNLAPLNPVFDMVKNNGDVDAFVNHVSDPRNSGILKALEPNVNQPEHVQAYNDLTASLGTTPKNLIKASLLANNKGVESDLNKIDPIQVMKNYRQIKSLPHLFSPQQEGNSTLYTPDDIGNIRELGTKLGFNEKDLTPADLAYEAAALATHGKGLLIPSASRTAAKLFQQAVPSGNKFIDSPNVVNSQINSGVSGSRNQIQQMLSDPSLILQRIPGLAGLLNNQGAQ